jgi:protein-disulfide isomerase
VESPIPQSNLTENVPASEGFKPVEQQPDSAYATPGTVMVIPRVFFNYVIIGIVFFAVGAVIGGAGISALFNANSKENRELIDTAVSAMAENIDVAGKTGLQPGQQYEVAVNETDAALGSPDAPITIVEFSDFHCPYCGRFVKETLHPLLENYDGKVKLVFRNYPILGQASALGALAGVCAKDQGKFWEFHDLMFANQQDLTRVAFLKYAEELSMDVETFTKCFDTQEHITEVQADFTYAQNLGITGTPAFFINGHFVSGAQPYSVFADMIDQQLGSLEESKPAEATS